MARAPSSTLSAAGVAGRGCGGGRGGRTWGGSFDVDLAPVSKKGLAHPAPPGVGAGRRDRVEIRANHLLHYDEIRSRLSFTQKGSEYKISKDLMEETGPTQTPDPIDKVTESVQSNLKLHFDTHALNR